MSNKLYELYYSDPLASITCSNVTRALVTSLTSGGNVARPIPVDDDSDDDAVAAVPVVRAAVQNNVRAAVQNNVRAAAVLPPIDLKNGNPDALEDTTLWLDIGKLQWVLKSDRVITPRAVETLINDLKDDNMLIRVRRAIGSIIAALSVVYPNAACSLNQWTQLVALGNEVAISACESEGLLEYFKNELQDINLADYLQLI